LSAGVARARDLLLALRVIFRGLGSPRRAGQAVESVVALAEEPAALFCYVRRVECGKKDTARTLS